jgi:uncharacterized circularly permuted ATP-grasp superfamily protein
LVVNSSQGGGTKDTWVLANDHGTTEQSQTQSTISARGGPA